MPDDIPGTTPDTTGAASNTPATAVAPDPGADDGLTIEKAMAEFNAIVTPKKKDDAAPPAKGKPEAKADPKATDKGAPKEGGKKDDATAPKKGDDKIDWEKADPKLKGAYFKAQREAQQKIESYEKRIKEIEAKSKEAPGDAKAIKDFQDRISSLEQEIAAADYSRSPEFKRQFIDKWQGEYKAAVSEISRLPIETTDAEGNVTRRAATEADFARLRQLPPGDQDEMASQLFGKFAPRVLARLLDLQRIERAADEAIKEHAGSIETRRAEEQAKTTREREEYERVSQIAQETLERDYPHLFAPNDEDPDASEALQKGYEFVDEAAKKSAQLTPEQRATYNALVRARAAAFNRVVFELNRIKAEHEELKGELEKYRGSDPGNSGKRSGGGGEDLSSSDAAEDGIDAAARAFNRR